MRRVPGKLWCVLQGLLRGFTELGEGIRACGRDAVGKKLVTQRRKVRKERLLGRDLVGCFLASGCGTAAGDYFRNFAIPEGQRGGRVAPFASIGRQRVLLR